MEIQSGLRRHMYHVRLYLLYRRLQVIKPDKTHRSSRKLLLASHSSDVLVFFGGLVLPFKERRISLQISEKRIIVLYLTIFNIQNTIQNTFQNLSLGFILKTLV